VANFATKMKTAPWTSDAGTPPEMIVKIESKLACELMTCKLVKDLDGLKKLCNICRTYWRPPMGKCVLQASLRRRMNGKLNVLLSLCSLLIVILILVAEIDGKARCVTSWITKFHVNVHLLTMIIMVSVHLHHNIYIDSTI